MIQLCLECVWLCVYVLCFASVRRACVCLCACVGALACARLTMNTPKIRREKFDDSTRALLEALGVYKRWCKRTSARATRDNSSSSLSVYMFWAYVKILIDLLLSRVEWCCCCGAWLVESGFSDFKSVLLCHRCCVHSERGKSAHGATGDWMCTM